jgi:hypothetical protein
MKELDGPDSQADSALNCYRTALRELRANLVITSPEIKRDIQSRLDRLSVTVNRKVANEVLESTAARLTEILADYRNHEESAFEEEQRQLRITIDALQALVAAIRRQDEEHNANLNVVLSGCHFRRRAIEGSRIRSANPLLKSADREGLGFVGFAYRRPADRRRRYLGQLFRKLYAVQLASG